MSECLFTYGSLMLPRVMAAVCRRELAGTPARLDAYARYALRGRGYPGLVPESGASTEGVVYAGLAQHDLARLDRFEGPLYQRVRVAVDLAEGAREHAFAYVVHPDQRGELSAQPWDLDRFAREDADRWIEELRARSPT